MFVLLTLVLSLSGKYSAIQNCVFLLFMNYSEEQEKKEKMDCSMQMLNHFSQLLTNVGTFHRFSEPQFSKTKIQTENLQGEVNCYLSL